MPGFANFDADAFLQDDWQRNPRLLRAALPDFCSPLSADELAGLALETDIEARIIEMRDTQWLLHHGPFQAQDMQRQHPWTLLVQAVDHVIPAVAQLRQLVSFIPGWRSDDVMVSYASDGGSVGPHYDNYDVFLLQGPGQREWRLGQQCDAAEALLPHDELRILERFEETARYTLSPGDILYVPPRLAHWGIARGDCMTYSIGFRAPRLNDLLSRWVDQVLEGLDADVFYRDPVGFSEARPGEINSQAVQGALRQVQDVLQQQEASVQWFGELVTEPRYAPATDQPGAAMHLSASVHLAADAKLAWCIINQELTVFANGVSLATECACQPWLELLCADRPLQGQVLADIVGNEAHLNLLIQLAQHGCVYGR